MDRNKSTQTFPLDLLEAGLGRDLCRTELEKINDLHQPAETEFVSPG